MCDNGPMRTFLEGVGFFLGLGLLPAVWVSGAAVVGASGVPDSQSAILLQFV